MTSAHIRSRRRDITGLGLGVAVAGALVLGSAAPAAAFADRPAAGCLKFTYTKSFFGKKQKLLATNTCSSGSSSFRVYSWSFISSETSPCITVAAGESGGWQWTKGRGNYKIIGC